MTRRNIGSLTASGWVPMLGGCLAWSRAWAEEDPNGFWSNTLPAVADPSPIAAWHPGSMLLALLLVLILMVGLSWLLRRTGLMSRQAAVDTPKEQMLFYARFNASQSLLLLEAEHGLRVVVLRGRKVEFMADVPDSKTGTSGLKKTGLRPAASSRTFQDLWMQFLNSGKRPRA